MAKRRKHDRPSPRRLEKASEPVAPAPERDYSAISVGLLLFAAVLFVFGRAIGNTFVTSDDVFITGNPHLKDGLSSEGVSWAFSTFHAGVWQPLTWLSYQLDFQFYNLAPYGFHLTGVLLHAASAVILFLTLRSLTGELARSACVAALFAVHPLRVAPVVWAAQRQDVLSVFFGMLALLAYADYARRPDALRYALVCAALALGLLAGPALVALPLLLLLLDYWPLGRFTGGRA